MANTERLLITGYPHHLVRKSSERRVAFHDEADYAHCVSQIRDLRQEYNLRVHAWCLLPDRIHLLATPDGEASDLSVFMKALSCRAALRRKKLYNQPSPWEPRYRSSLVEPGQWLMATMCYIERLPVLYGLATSAYQYYRSSYRMRLGKTCHYWLDDPEEYERLGVALEERAEAYRNYMRMGLDSKETTLIDSAVMRGQFTGSDRFLREVEQEYGVRLGNRSPGRPRKCLKE